MQRRAAAAYFLFFLVVSVAAYAFIGVAESQRPEVQLDGPELTNDSTFTSGGQTYTVSNIHQAGGGGHGGGGSMAADLAWTNNSSQYSATVAGGSTLSRDNTTYNVSIDNSTGTLVLTAQQNVTALLQNDSAVENSLATQDGERFVVYRANNSTQPLDEWLPEPETVSYTTGDQFVYPADSGTQTTTIVNVTNSSATVEWTAPRQRTVELGEGGNVTLADGQYFAHFTNQSAVQLVSTDQYSQYQATLADQDYFDERKNGLWGISILSGIASVLMLGMAYLPNRG